MSSAENKSPDVAAAPSESSNKQAQEPVKLTTVQHGIYYTILFFFHWFGAARFFDADGDGDFDPEDVVKFSRDPSIITKNFTSKRSQSSISRQGTSSQAVGQTASTASNASKGSKPPATQAPAAQGAGQPGGQQAAPPPGSQEEAKRGHLLDSNGDGQVNLEDLFESKVEKIEGGPSQGEELAILEAYKTGQMKPWFVLVQTLLTFVMWFILAAVSTATDGTDFLMAKAGLASFDDELFDLRVTTDCEDQRFEVWRWFTYQWTHIGISHVGMNTFLLILFGIPLEGVHGSLRLFLMFNIGVLGGALCTFLSDVSSPVVGMSGGDYALMGMTLADLVMNWHQKKFRKPTLCLVIFLAAADLLLYNSGSSENVSHSGHFGGYVAGTLIGLVAGYNYAWTGLERKLQALAFVIGALCVIFCLTWSWAQWPPRTLWTLKDEISCWHRAVWNTSLFGSNEWLCVRCSDQSCIDSYTTTQTYIETVSADWCVEYPS